MLVVIFPRSRDFIFKRTSQFLHESLRCLHIEVKGVKYFLLRKNKSLSLQKFSTFASAIELRNVNFITTIVSYISGVLDLGVNKYLHHAVMVPILI